MRMENFLSDNVKGYGFCINDIFPHTTYEKLIKMIEKYKDTSENMDSLFKLLKALENDTQKLAHELMNIEDFIYCKEKFSTFFNKGEGLNTLDLTQIPMEILNDSIGGVVFTEYKEGKNNNLSKEDHLIVDYDGPIAAVLMYSMLTTIPKELDIKIKYCWNECTQKSYIIYEPRLPWDMSKKEQNLKKEDIEKSFSEYISQLTDRKIQFIETDTLATSSERCY